VEEAKQLFKKLKIQTLLDLVLITPHSYSDTTLSSKIEIGKIHTFEAKVISAKMYGSTFRISFELKKFSKRLFSILFYVTPYHHRLFVVGSTHFIQGKITQYNDEWQMNQPKALDTINRITPKYKTTLKQTEIKSLIEAYVTPYFLEKENLTSQEREIILSLHFPKNLKDIYEDKAFNSRILETLKFIEAYNHLKKLRRKQSDFPAISLLKGDITPFVENLPFELTKEQKSVIKEIKKDLKRKAKASKRMVVGDVGSGKTMVILASVMMAQPHKSILMAPTSLLALQLYEEAVKYLPNSISVALVMQGKKSMPYHEANFIIGTHALLFKKDLPVVPLVMVDEQHRFGTKQRASLEELVSKGNRRPHFIQFSATPIPRTQAMMDSELIDMSLITTTPFEREILTQHITREDFPDLLEHIKEEISHNHQVLIIYPLVEESEKIHYQSLEESRGFWEERFENVFVTHGKDKEKEEILVKFREEGNILLATTVVEVGISLPRLTLIVIVGAERFGLATLHQLRGRVGRNGLKSWCYLYSNLKQSSRLLAFTKTTNGFDIAKLDLKFRDSGDIIDGTIQSGQKFKYLDMSEDEEVVSRAKQRLK